MTNANPMLAPAPLERIQLPAALDGRSGSNRAPLERLQLGVRDDVGAIISWLGRFEDTKTTYTSYRKEAERLLLWSVIELKKPFSSLTHDDLIAYHRFIAAPKPEARWVMEPGRKWSRYHADWRPFAGPLSANSQRQTLVIVNTLFSWLVNAGYLAVNPLSLSRQRQRHAQPRVTRFLDDGLWKEVKTTIETMPRESDREREHYSRVRWLFSLLYLCGMRISEVRENRMGSFYCRRNAEGEERWWLEITGKGNKTRLIPATDELMVELARYRRELGLRTRPVKDESTPLLLPIGGAPRALTRSAIHIIIKDIFARTAARFQGRGPDQEHLLHTLEQASAHWLRHTAGSSMADGMDLRHVRDNLGHSSITTTNLYLHSEDDARHKETEEKHRLDW